MSVLEVRPKFLYPYKKQFPFDEVAEKIVKAMEKRNWKVPGITVEFDIFGSGKEKYKLVRCITGDDFKLYFYRKQEKLSDNLYDTAGLSRICIPKQILEVYDEGEEWTNYYLYVGSNWYAEKDWFMNSIKVDAKMYREARRYLKYEFHVNKYGNKKLIFENNFGREYSPRMNEPFFLNFERKLNEFKRWLKEFVLDYILSFLEVDEVQLPEIEEELIPYKGPWSRIFSICNSNDAKRIKKGKREPNEFPPAEQHAYFGSGCRLVPLDVNCDSGYDGKYPEIANRGFIWCDVNSKEKDAKISDFIYQVASVMASYGILTDYIVAINLKYGNHVYVVDNSAFKETRNKLFQDIAPRERLTNEEINIAIIARAITIIPITEYKGDYKEPIVLINRELDFEEIEWISEIKN